METKSSEQSSHDNVPVSFTLAKYSSTGVQAGRPSYNNDGGASVEVNYVVENSAETLASFQTNFPGFNSRKIGVKKQAYKNFSWTCECDDDNIPGFRIRKTR